MKAAYCAIVFTVVVIAGLRTPDAQTAPASQTSDVTVSGCIMQAERTGSLADDTGAGVRATPNTAPVDANSAEALDAYLLTNASVAGLTDQNRAVPRSYTLQGLEQELAKHRGHHVEITGRLLPARATAAASTKATAPGIERIAVHTVKMLNLECPAKTP